MGRNLRLFFGVVSVLFTASLSAAPIRPVLELGFRDRCTGEDVAFTSPNGNDLELKLTGIPEGASVPLEFRWRIAGAPDADTLESRVLIVMGDTQSPNVFRFALPKPRSLREMLYKNPQSRMLEVSVEARAERHFVQASTHILLSPSGFEYFVKESTPVCHYFTNALVQSGYVFNDGPSPMEIKRKFSRSSETGAGREYSPLFYSGMGIDRYFHSLLEIEREWELVAGQGGVFAERIHFTRFLASRYQWDPNAKGACGAFVRRSQGVLDLGREVVDFFTIPKSFSGNPVQIKSFLDSRGPSLSTCPADSAPTIIDFPAFSEFHYRPVAK